MLYGHTNPILAIVFITTELTSQELLS